MPSIATRQLAGAPLMTADLRKHSRLPGLPARLTRGADRDRTQAARTVVVVCKSRYRNDRANRFEGAGIGAAIGVTSNIYTPSARVFSSVWPDRGAAWGMAWDSPCGSERGNVVSEIGSFA